MTDDTRTRRSGGSEGRKALPDPLPQPGAGQPQGEFFATADQALFTANAGALLGWTGAGGGNLTERMINQADSAITAEDPDSVWSALAGSVLIPILSWPLGAVFLFSAGARHPELGKSFP